MCKGLPITWKSAFQLKCPIYLYPCHWIPFSVYPWVAFCTSLHRDDTANKVCRVWITECIQIYWSSEMHIIMRNKTCLLLVLWIRLEHSIIWFFIINLHSAWHDTNLYNSYSKFLAMESRKGVDRVSDMLGTDNSGFSVMGWALRDLTQAKHTLPTE